MKNIYTLLIIFGVLPFLLWPKISNADERWGHHGEHHYYRYHDHPHFGFHVSAFYPDEYYPVWVGGARYYYDDGLYYNYAGGNYVVVAPPAGAVVSTVPSDFQAVVINGVTYYTDKGTYYLRTPSGYEVVVPPAVQEVSNSATISNVVTVNVPSDKGGYVAITLKRSGNGYVGPQGEFYSQFPKVSQLQTMYGR